MKKINLSITKCINSECKFRIVSKTIMKVCPMCKGKLVKEPGFAAQGIDGDTTYITLQKKVKKVKK